MKKVILSVTNDLVTDSRVHKVALTLLKMNFKVVLVGRKLPGSSKLGHRPYKTKRLKLFFKKGPLFYAEYNIRLFWFLRLRKGDVFLANDLDTLPANFLISKLKGKPLVYDSHELFTEVPELLNRPGKKAFWRAIERLILPKISKAYTVSESIARLYQKKYGTPFRVVRNLPHREELLMVPPEKSLTADERKLILYQGALNIGRGLEYAIKAMQHLKGARLLIVGDGDITLPLKKLVADLKLADRVSFMGKIPLQELKYLTAQAHLGLSIEEDLGLNYRYALPNKLFDYIQQQVPVLVSNLPEMRAIVEAYQIGMILEKHDPEVLAKQLQEALFNRDLREQWIENLPLAARDLCWEHEEKILEDIFRDLR
ncbi:glycosyltransferase [uncultured Sunxiuqinia sp.]|uniref:glycosyltransferase n=1 Tax=uncultured Sunxiuqinia sp. TaxID=1573825 RepID=UPI002617455E|nr:glycosyltransferase [uncultured Sunxiuqinia sp.]